MSLLKRLSGDRRGFAIYLAMLLMVTLVIIGAFLLEKLGPVARSTKGIELGAVAYYRAAGAIEEALATLSGSNPWPGASGTVGSLSSTGYAFTVTGSGTSVPKPGYGNSEYDSNFNTIAPGKPVQIKLPAGFNPGGTTGTSHLSVVIRVPDLDGDGSHNDQTLTGAAVTPYVTWTIAGTGDTLTADTGHMFLRDGIKNSTAMTFDAASLTGAVLSGSVMRPLDFGTANCAGVARCVVKLSVVRELLTDDGMPVPYLEYQIVSAASIPQQYTRIEAEGYERGFKRKANRSIQQNTANEALDFTVFQ